MTATRPKATHRGRRSVQAAARALQRGWLGVPESPGPRHHFTEGYEEAPCGAFRHERDRPDGGRGQCLSCRRFLASGRART
jgi:hypothetical protein